MTGLQDAIEEFFALGAEAVGNKEAEGAFHALRDAIEAGELRSAEPDPGSELGWKVNAWVKRGILLGFRLGQLTEMSGGGLSFVDKGTYPASPVHGDGWRSRGSGRQFGAGGRLCGQGRGLHATDVHQRRRLRG